MLGASRAFSLLHTTYGVYFTYGNHDKGYFDAQSRGWSSDELVSALEASGVTILEDEAVEIGKDYYLVGRQDASTKRGNRRRATMAELIEPLDKDRYIIVMDHQPTDYDAQAEAKVDLVLSGHTHGGQILGVSYLGELAGINCNTYGHERRQMTDFIVTSGIGTWEIKFKPSSPAEYVIIDISK
jgi:predicted MPP superfamily phosphohydrolase